MAFSDSVLGSFRLAVVKSFSKLEIMIMCMSRSFMIMIFCVQRSVTFSTTQTESQNLLFVNNWPRRKNSSRVCVRVVLDF